MLQGGVDLVLKFTAPDGFSSSTVAFRVPSLAHEAFDNSVEKHVVIVAILCMGRKVLDRLRTLGGKEITVDFSLTRVDDHLGRQI